MWTVQQIPELGHLGRGERRQVLSPVLTPFVRAKLIVMPIAAGILPAVAGVQLLIVRRLPLIGIVLVVLAVAFAVYVRTHLISRLRKGLRDYLSNAEGEGVFIVCLGCGFDLRGSRSGRCPECGRCPSGNS